MTTYITSNSPFLPKTGKKPQFYSVGHLIPHDPGEVDLNSQLQRRSGPLYSIHGNSTCFASGLIKKKKKRERVPLLRSTRERSLKNGLTASSEHWGLRAWLPSCHQAEQETNTLWKPHPNQRTSGTLPHHTQGTASLRDPCVTEWMSLHKPT